MERVGVKKEAGSGFVDMWRREMGSLNPRLFSHRAASSSNLVLRLGIHRTLDKHRGCVNTVSFNADGSLLVSGSDDRMIMLWDWELGLLKQSFHSGHMSNVFQAKFMPYTNDRTMVTCAADGEVRLAQLKDGRHVATKVLARHVGRAHKIAIEPGSPHILYSCGEDGLVHHFDLRTQTATKLFKCKAFKEKSDYMPIIHLHSIAIDPMNPHKFAIAGSDEYARVYDIRKCRWDGKACGDPADCFCPHLIGDEQVGITGLAFSNQSELLASYTVDQIYLFSKDQGLGADPDSATPASAEDPNDGNEQQQQVYTGHRNCATVKGVSFFGPDCEYVTSGSDCGRVFIWKKAGGELLRVMEGDKHVVNCIEANPFATMLASCGIERDIKIWIPNSKEPAPPVNIDEIMMHEGITFFSGDDLDDDDDDDDDNDLIDFLDIDIWSNNDFSDDDFYDENDEDDDDVGASDSAVNDFHDVQ